MSEEKPDLKVRKAAKKGRYRGCPLTKNRSPWCFRICTPSHRGRGRCNRIAPHSLRGRTDLAIEAEKKKSG